MFYQRRLRVKRKATLLGVLIVFIFGANAWASLASGSLSTPILFDSSCYTKPPTSYENRIPVADPPGGLTASAAWDQYGMRLDWEVSSNGDGTYTYDYFFGPGWYPSDNGTKSNPWVTNKQIVALDLQLGAGMTMGNIIDPTWFAYDYKKTLLGYGTAAQYTFIDQTTQAETTTSAVVIAVGELNGKTGNGTDGYVMNQLFHGLRWLDPIDPVTNGYVFSDDVNVRLSFKSALAPGWGNFFANSTQTGAERNFTEVAAYNPFNSNTVSTPGGAPVPLPPSILLLGSGLLGMGVFRRRIVA
jgi:hypothetical protein